MENLYILLPKTEASEQFTIDCEAQIENIGGNHVVLEIEHPTIADLLVYQIELSSDIYETMKVTLDDLGAEPALNCEQYCEKYPENIENQ